MPADIRVVEVTFDTEDYQYRTPIKFGGVALDRVTILNAACVVRGSDGRTASGCGSMPLGNVWALPSRQLAYDETLGVMLDLADRIAEITSTAPTTGHPIDINHALEPAYYQAAQDLADERRLAEPIPQLATLVVASPFDAAIHDAYGKLHGLNCYHTYGRDFLPHDLGHYLGAGLSRAST